MTYIDKRHAEDWQHHADVRNDERIMGLADKRHIVVIYGNDSVETAIALEEEARRKGWTILYRESEQ